MPDAEPLGKFLARTASARPEQIVVTRSAGATWPSRPIPEAELRRMQDFIRERYRDVRPVSSFVDPAGVTIDCIPFDQQPSVRAARAAGIPVQKGAPPPPPPATGAPRLPAPDTANRPGTGVPAPPPPSKPKPQCPPGFVPLVRITLEELVRYGTLENYFRKAPAPGLPPAGPPPAPAGVPPPG